MVWVKGWAVRISDHSKALGDTIRRKIAFPYSAPWILTSSALLRADDLYDEKQQEDYIRVPWSVSVANFLKRHTRLISRSYQHIRLSSALSTLSFITLPISKYLYQFTMQQLRNGYSYRAQEESLWLYFMQNETCQMWRSQTNMFQMYGSQPGLRIPARNSRMSADPKCCP